MSKRYCEHCDRIAGEDEKFCTHCGKKTEPNGKVKKPYALQVLYGPPYSVKHLCKKCGKVYIEHGLGSPRARYCPDCGAENDPGEDIY